MGKEVLAMIHTHTRRAVLLLAALGIGGVRAAADDADAPGDLQPVAPVAHARLFDPRNYGGMDGGYALSPDGKTLVAAMHNSLLIYEPGKAGPFQQPRNVILPNFYFGNSVVAFTPDGKTVAGMPAQHVEDASVRFWDVATGKEVRQLDNDQPFFGMAFSADGKRLALGGQQRVEVWDAATGDDVRVFTGAPNSLYRTLAFSPDGKTLAVSGVDTTVQLWEMATGKERWHVRLPADPAAPNQPYFRGFVQGVSALAFAPSGRFLAAGGNDRAVHLWDLSSGEELPPLTGHTGAVRALVFTPDGRRLVSFDQDGLRLVWSTASFEKGPPARLLPLGERDFEDLWADLAEGDAFQTYRAVRHMRTEPGRAVALLRQKVHPVPAGDTRHINQLIADLQGADAALRRKAMGELRKLGEPALGGLYLIADNQRGNRTVSMMIHKLEMQEASVDRTRALAAVQILEQLGTDDARQLLGQLAAGAPGVKLTVEAKAALERLRDAAKADRSRPARPKGEDVEALWNDLAGDDAAKAYRAIGRLAAAPGQALPLLRARLKPVAAPDGKRLDRLLSDLENDDFARRQRAEEELARLGPLAGPALKERLAAHPALDTRRRIEHLLERLTPGQAPAAETLRALRAIEVLERMPAAEGKPILEALAAGAPEALLTQDARAALGRR
jgi:hypothetical protein